VSEQKNSIPEIVYEKAKKKDYLEFFFFRVFSFIWQCFPQKVSIYLCSRVALILKAVFKKRNSLAIEKITQNLNVDQEKADDILSGAYVNFSSCWVAMVNCNHITTKMIKEQMNLIGFGQFDELKKQGRGAIIANMHIGWWEISPRVFRLLEIPLAVMVAVQHNPLSDKYINKFRAQEGYHKILHNRLSVRHTLKFLKNGGFLVIVADVDAGRHGIPLPFLNENGSTSTWPAQLSKKTDSPIIVGINYNSNNNVRTFEMHKAFDPRDYEGSEDSVKEMSLAMNDKMSAIIEEYPEQWFWLQRRWKTEV
jgi:Kdo2-lipid IVA lauroyltransferase/acyltransferase